MADDNNTSGGSPKQVYLIGRDTAGNWHTISNQYLNWATGSGGTESKEYTFTSSNINGRFYTHIGFVFRQINTRTSTKVYMKYLAVEGIDDYIPSKITGLSGNTGDSLQLNQFLKILPLFILSQQIDLYHGLLLVVLISLNFLSIHLPAN